MPGRRVLIVVENLPVPPDRRVWQECLALVAAGYGVSVICPKGRGYEKSFETIDGVEIHRHGLPLDASGILGFVLEYAAALFWQTVLAWWIFLTRGFDAIQACNPPDSIWIVAWPFRVLFGRKFVFDHHDPFAELFAFKFPHRTLLHRLTLMFERRSIRDADLVITTSEALRHIAVDRAGKPAACVHLVRSCPDTQAMTRRAADPALRDGAAKVVVYIGIMGAQDGVEILLRAAADAIKRRGRSDLRFLLVGDGPEYAHLRALAAELGIADRVNFTGFLRGEALLTAMSSADIGACPDPWNNFNDKLTMNKVLEYMAMDLPCVMFDLTEGRAIAGEAAVYAGRTNDPAVFADAMLALLDDPERCRRMGSAGRARVKALFDWKDHRRVYLDAYASLWR
ncbi:MAG: glycosyltransferase family 4 protein [Alphaproteobacteria bacterium]|nr:glycosyltransferase family 4 protein [Alphaproteobacteria bacterium]